MKELIKWNEKYITPVGLQLPPNLPFSDWFNLGEKLRKINSLTLWAWGDWLNYGEGAYPDKFSQALEFSDYESETLRKATYVCIKIEIGRRRPLLSYALHQEVAPLEAELQDKLLGEAEKNHLTRRELRVIVRKIKTALHLTELPKKEHQIIYADPPWLYDFAPTNDTAIESHYMTMEVEEICKLKIPSSQNSALFLWATNPKLLEAIEVMAAWGFEYKTNYCWDKIIPTYSKLGYWSFGRHELLLIGTKGNFSPPPPEKRPESLFSIKKTKHSKKPVEVYELIENLFPNHSYLELFARNTRNGWTSWGSENTQFPGELKLCEPGGIASL